MVDATVWLYWLGGQVLGGAGVSLALWGLLGDRLLRGHTKRRCPKCWHEMTGMPGLKCPECGREAKREAGLFRSRRRWRLAAVGVVGLMLGTVVIGLPQLRRPDWPLLLPTPVLAALWPDLGVADDPLFLYAATDSRLGAGTKAGLSALALRWSTGRVLRSDPFGARASAAFSMLAKAGLRSEQADAAAARVFALRAADATTLPRFWGLRENAFGYVGQTHPARELFEALSAYEPTVDYQLNAHIERALLGATRRDLSLIERWLQRRARMPFPTSTDWPRAQDPEWADWWFAATPILTRLVGDAPPTSAPDSFTNLLRFGLDDWTEALGHSSSIDTLEPLLARARGNDEVARVLVGLFERVRMPGLTDRLLAIASEEHGGVFAAIIATRAARNVEPLTDAAAQFFVRRLASSDTATAQKALEVLGRAPPSTVGPLLDLLGHTEAGVRERAVKVIGGIKPQPQEVYLPVRRLAEDPAQPVPVRAAARAALGWWPEPPASPE